MLRPAPFAAVTVISWGLSLGLSCLGGAVAAAQAPLLTTLGGPQGFGTSCLHANDDQSSNSIDLRPAFPGGLRFFSDTYTSVFVNTNGNLTFGAGLSDYTPDPFPVADRPMIAPFWADVDIRVPPSCSNGTRGVCANPAENGVWWALEPGRMIATWDDVGYYECNNDLRMRFQLILTSVASCAGVSTDFNVEFRYNVCEWETGDEGGGSMGFGGIEAQVGFDAGNDVDFVELPGSRVAGISASLCTGSNVGDPGVWRFEIRQGTVVCPGAGAACITTQPGVCTEGVMQCVGAGMACQPVVAASDETCDALDNDCNGSVDEGDAICAGAQVCDRGRCVESCFEGGCPEGLGCTADGRCVDAGCEEIECEAEERCVLGACRGACEGVVCPLGQSCRGGGCLDLCAEITCDPACTACVEGECLPRCDLSSDACDSGETCSAAGLCEPTACAGVDCAAGERCVAGSGCVDACTDAVCPTGETCMGGECQRVDPEPPPDAGNPVEPGDDAAVPPPIDAGMDGDFDAGRIGGEPPMPPPRGTECICSAPGARRVTPTGLLAIFGLVGLVALRRR